MDENENQLHRALGHIEGKIDTIIDSQGEFKRRTELLENRIGAVEAKVNRWGGGIAVILAAYVFIGEKIRNVLFGS